MTYYILRRLLYIIPVMGSILVLLFVLQDVTREDQFENLIGGDQSNVTYEEEKAIWSDLANRRGWNRPVFYFGFESPGWSSACYSAFSLSDQKFARQVGKYTLDPTQTIRLGEQLLMLKDQIKVNDSFKELSRLFALSEATQVIRYIDSNASPDASKMYDQVRAEIKKDSTEKSIFKAMPRLQWNGKNNRFHFFISSFFTSSWRSKIDGRPVFQKIWPAATITLFINVLALILLLIIGVPFGMYLFKVSNWRTALAEKILYFIYAMPLFWVATIIAMKGSDWGIVRGIPNLQAGETPSVLTFIRPENLGFLLLPILTIVVSVLVVVAIHMKRSMQEVGDNKFVFASRLRGLESGHVDRVHIRPNALFSIVTLVGNSLPGLISGSVVIEIIFNLPGMGRLLWQALYDYDWSLVFGVLFIGIFFSVLGQLLVDLYYRKINPQVAA